MDIAITYFDAVHYEWYHDFLNTIVAKAKEVDPSMQRFFENNCKIEWITNKSNPTEDVREYTDLSERGVKELYMRCLGRIAANMGEPTWDAIKDTVDTFIRAMLVDMKLTDRQTDLTRAIGILRDGGVEYE